MPHPLDPWFYQIESLGVVPGIYPGDKEDKDTEALLNRQACRYTLLVQQVAERFNFRGKRVLDIACNCGFWSNEYRKMGALSILGIEGRPLFIKQAKLVNPEDTFILSDVVKFDYSTLRPFEFVLCAGILYHIMDHAYLLRELASVNSDVLVVDTRVGNNDRLIVEEPRNLCFNAIDSASSKIVPSKERLFEILDDVGYSIEQLKPTFKTMHGVDGEDDYNAGNRICLFCRKR